MFITKSKLLQFKECPLQFKFKYLDRLKEDTPNTRVTTKGLDLHKLFNLYFENESLEVPEIYTKEYELFCQWEQLYNTNQKPIFREHTVKALDLYGIIDRINFDGYNYSLIDYKSGIYSPSELRFELCFYKYLVDSANILDKPIRFIGIYGYNKGDFLFEEVKPISYNLMLEKVNTFRSTNFKEISYPKKQGFHCTWCNYCMACKNTTPQRSLESYL